MTLRELGWDSFFAAACPRENESVCPARVIVELRGQYVVANEAGERIANLSGRFRHFAARGEYPVVGDWVLIKSSHDQALIQSVLPRRTKFSRNAAGRAVQEQVIAANIDTVFVVASLSVEVNVRKIERFLTLACESGASPAILLTKCDLCDDSSAAAEAARNAVPGTPVLAVSAVSGEGLQALESFLLPGKTVALLGPSGVGKSTLINALAGDELQAVQEVREKDEKGRHTTTRRELFRLPSGALVIDTPGMRELQLWEGEEGIEHAFADVMDIAARCRFSNCQHRAEPGCAVREAVESGALSRERLASFQKLQREQAHFEERFDSRAQAKKKAALKTIMKGVRENYRLRGKK